ncbi:MAG: CapA family protein, partial [Bacteroidota bacterium]
MRSTPLTYFRPRHCGQLFLIFLLLSGWLASSVYAFSPSPPDSLSANEDTLRLLFVGDVMGHGPQIRSAEILKNKVYNYDPCFQYVKPIIQQADLAIANLEVTLPGKPPYQGYPRFRSPNDLAHALRSAGFDLLVTANNHSNDAGKAGVISTIKTVQELGFYQTGTFKNQLDRDVFYPLLVYKNGFKLAFLNYTYDTNKIPTRPPTVVNEIDEALIKADLAEAQQLKPDAIIVVMHWGNEYRYA